MASLEDFFSIKAAAAEIGIEANALYVRIHRGSVEVHKISGTLTVLHKDEVARLKKEKDEASC